MPDANHQWLVEILLPLTYNDGANIPDEVLASIHQELVDRFGGLTAFTRSPAEGVWTSESGTGRDDIVVLEVMAHALDRAWWADWRKRTEVLLHQEEIVARATRMDRL